MSDWVIQSRRDESCEADMDCLGVTFFKYMKKNSGNIAQIDAATGKKQTYEELLSRSIRVAQHLQELGVTSEDIISISAFNSFDSCLPFLAAQFLGAKVASLDPTLSCADSEHLLKLVNPRLIFCCEDSVELIETALENTGLGTDIIVFGDTEKHLSISKFVAPTGTEDEFEPRHMRIFDTAVIFFSSGTTGLPKGICNSHYGLISQQRYILQGHDTSVFLYFTTFYWISAVMLLIMSVLEGSARVIFKKFEEEQVMRAIEEHKVSHCFIAPTFTYKLTQNSKLSIYDTSSLKSLMVGGGVIGEEQIKNLKKLLPYTNIYYTYGMTEASGCVSIFHPILDKELMKKKLTSVGRAVAGLTYKVIDPETNEKLGPNMKGEIMIKGDCVMIGYHNNPVETANVWDDEGFLHTGDVGYIDEDECFYVVDRIKDMMKYQAWHVVPAELETILLTHPDVKEAAVIGIPHEIDGEHPLGVVVRKPGTTSTENDILTFFNEKMPDRKKLHGGLTFVETLPHTPSGKLRRRDLRKSILRC